MTVVSYYVDTSSLNDLELFDELYMLQPKYRKDKIDGFRFHKDKALSLGAGILLQHVLIEHGIENVEPKYGKYGKPLIEGISFNLSHSEERAMCSISDTDVGCDVQFISEMDLDIARDCFFQSEFDLIMSSDDLDKRKDLFFRLWTLKESFIKTTGLGLNIPLDLFDITLGDSISVHQTVDEKEYHFQEYRIEKEYRYSCCSTDVDFETEIRKIIL